MENHHAIQVQGLCKRFAEIQAVQCVSFDVAQGQIFSLLGPNGAGKSTTISMLSCLLELARTELQVMTFSFIAMILFAALGGAWFPLETAGSAFSRVGHLLPTAFAMDGLQNIVVRGMELGSALLPAGVLLAYAAGFLGLAVWRFRFE